MSRAGFESQYWDDQRKAAAAEIARDERARIAAALPANTLRIIKTNAEFALATGAVFDLQRCVELCAEALKGQA